MLVKQVFMELVNSTHPSVSWENVKEITKRGLAIWSYK